MLINIINLIFSKKNFLLRMAFKNFCSSTPKCIYSIIPLDKYYLLFLDILYHYLNIGLFPGNYIMFINNRKYRNSILDEYCYKVMNNII